MSLETLAVGLALILNVLVLLGGLYRLHRVASRVEHAFDYFSLEHELLMQDYAERKGLKLSAVSTRLRRAPWWEKSRGI